MSTGVRPRADLNWIIGAPPLAGDIDLAWSILLTVAYSDLFDFPLVPKEIHHYLVGADASRGDVDRALAGDARLRARLADHAGMIHLAGRREILDRRAERREVSRRLWPSALRFGEAIARLPFVQMVGVTGALALENADSGGDIDYLIVTEPGRLWLTRATVILIVRLAARTGLRLCPNYFLSRRALRVPDESLFTAHEMTQMIPLAGLRIYWEMRERNEAWVRRHLPNAAGLPPSSLPGVPSQNGHRQPWPSRWLERGMRGPWLDAVEAWEMRRKVTRFSGEEARVPEDGLSEARYAAEWCKGHRDGHGNRTMEAFAQRRQELAADWK